VGSERIHVVFSLCWYWLLAPLSLALDLANTARRVKDFEINLAQMQQEVSDLRGQRETPGMA
jgi:hypothetical protein